MNMNKHLHSKDRGSAMPLALVAVMILLAVGVGLLSLGYNSRIFSIRTASDITARCAADSGLTKALFEMNEQLKVKPWNDSTLPLEKEISLPNCDAVYSYTVTSDSGGYILESTGKCGQAERTVSCNLKVQGPFEAAIFTKGLLNLNDSAVVDWYNYDKNDSSLKVGTNSIAPGSVTLHGSALVKGDVAVGAGGDTETAISVASGSVIEGQTSALTEKVELLPVTVPEWLESLPSGGTIQGDTTINNSAKYSDINLQNNKKIVISGDVTLYITGDLILGNSAELQIEDDSSLVLYLGGDLEGKNSSTINNETKDTKSLQIFGLDSCELMQFKNSSDFYGVIYAPDTDVVMNNSATVYGAAVSKTYDMKNSGVFMYDASLRNTDFDDEAVRFVVTNWHEQ